MKVRSKCAWDEIYLDTPRLDASTSDLCGLALGLTALLHGFGMDRLLPFFHLSLTERLDL